MCARAGARSKHRWRGSGKSCHFFPDPTCDPDCGNGRPRRAGGPGLLQPARCARCSGPGPVERLQRAQEWQGSQVRARAAFLPSMVVVEAEQPEGRRPSGFLASIHLGGLQRHLREVAIDPRRPSLSCLMHLLTCAFCALAGCGLLHNFAYGARRRAAGRSSRSSSSTWLRRATLAAAPRRQRWSPAMTTSAAAVLDRPRWRPSRTGCRPCWPLVATRC